MTPDQWLRLSPLPKNEARMLLQHAGGYSRIELVTRGGDEMPDSVRQHAAIGRLPECGSIWDLGTGSGAVALTVALERPDAFVRASDISLSALETARKNAADLGAAVEFAHGSWFDTDMPSERQWDVIVSNPPYIENGDIHLSQGDLRFEPKNALTDFSDGMSCIRALAEGAPKYLADGGFLLLEHGFNQGGAVRGVLAAHGFTEVETLTDLAGLDRVTFGKYMKHLK